MGTPQHKLFEAEMLRQMCRHLKPNGPLEFATRLGDGMERKTDRFGRQITVHMYKMPSDFMAWTTDGRIVLVEAKHLSDGTSLSVVPAKTKGSGLHEHQMRSLVSAQTSGGVGLLVVCFAAKGAVFALDGLGLGIWMEGADASGKELRKSISYEHFREYGTCLGEPRKWAFEVTHFTPQGAGTKFRDGPIFLSNTTEGVSW